MKTRSPGKSAPRYIYHKSSGQARVKIAFGVVFKVLAEIRLFSLIEQHFEYNASELNRRNGLLWGLNHPILFLKALCVVEAAVSVDRVA